MLMTNNMLNVPIEILIKIIGLCPAKDLPNIGLTSKDFLLAARVAPLQNKYNKITSNISSLSLADFEQRLNTLAAYFDKLDNLAMRPQMLTEREAKYFAIDKINALKMEVVKQALADLAVWEQVNNNQCDSNAGDILQDNESLAKLTDELDSIFAPYHRHKQEWEERQQRMALVNQKYSHVNKLDRCSALSINRI